MDEFASKKFYVLYGQFEGTAINIQKKGCIVKRSARVNIGRVRVWVNRLKLVRVSPHRIVGREITFDSVKSWHVESILDCSSESCMTLVANPPETGFLNFRA